MRNSRVYVVQENQNLDYTDAERFGEVVFLTNMEYRPMASSKNNVDLLNQIDDGLSKFDPEQDYVILTGNPITLGYAFHRLLSNVGDGTPVAILRWVPQDGRYKPVQFQH